jgi:hypothetical protein
VRSFRFKSPARPRESHFPTAEVPRLRATTGTSIERAKAADYCGSTALKRSPGSRMRYSKSMPEGSALVMPDMSTRINWAGHRLLGIRLSNR